MKTIVSKKQQRLVWLAAVSLLLSLPALAEPTPPPTPATPQPPTPPAAPRTVVRIESVEQSPGSEAAKDVTWLGVYSEEVSEALGSQLSLESGEGLVVTYVATDSPAAKAGLQKNDVLVQLGDQLLVNQDQLAKLIRAQKEGDSVMLTLYRQGKKQTVSTTLGKRTEESGALPGSLPPGAQWNVRIGEAIDKGIHQQMKSLHGTLLRLGADKEQIQLEVERSVEQARKALEEVLSHKTQSGSEFGVESKELEALGKGGVDINQDATVIVKKDGRATKTIVQTDDTGSYIIVANPQKRLTAHDKDGKLVFDGEIETEEQQQKVPAPVWEKVKPMLQQMGPVDDREGKPHAQSEDDAKS
jgi:hypothetical protein